MLADCIVVGGGVIGMFTAWELAKAGCKVVLLERHRLGQEASWAGAGILG
ncbi:MAG: FAD-dependent oxidoreductase, partial [Gammaproteobacteria bacterium]